MTEKQQLHHYVLRLGDTPLILAQRLCEWCGHAPEIEIDLALSNIGLDLLGQARNFLSYAAELKGAGNNEDTLAYLRDEREFSNLLLVEQPNDGFNDTLVRQFFIDAYHVPLYRALTQSSDPQLAAIAEKSLKEALYHLRFSRGWMIRLGDGTQESHDKIQEAVNNILPYVKEAFLLAPYQKALVEEGLISSPEEFQATWLANVKAILDEATIEADVENAFVQKGGKEGVHTEHLGFILTDLQYLQRTYPDSQW